jgi:hypothetical protein
MDSITYTAPDYASTPRVLDNGNEVLAFVGEQPPCPTCGDYGEYEGEYGPVGCSPCVSRLIAFIAFDGRRVFADWGDTIERRDDGLHLISGDA